MVYGLGRKGESLLCKELGADLSWRRENHSVRRIFLEHALLVSDVMVTIELACRQTSVYILTERELGNKRFRWKVKVNGLSVGVVPDRVFALEFRNAAGKSQRTVFFLEADRGTMPVVRKNLVQTSFYRKLLAYASTWSQSIHRLRFGFDRFRVLTVTTSAERVKSMVHACSQLNRGQGLFLFADRTILDEPSGVFNPIWQSGNHGETSSLLD
jgi:hypothetical protein